MVNHMDKENKNQVKINLKENFNKALEYKVLFRLRIILTLEPLRIISFKEEEYQNLKVGKNIKEHLKKESIMDQEYINLMIHNYIQVSLGMDNSKVLGNINGQMEVYIMENIQVIKNVVMVVSKKMIMNGQVLGSMVKEGKKINLKKNLW